MSATIATTLQSSVVRKQIVGITGLLLCGFLATHLAGNLLIFVGPEAFNKYAYALTSNPLIYLAEAILLLIFLTHLGLALKLTLENHQARPEKYYAKKRTGRGATLASSTMPYTGLVLLAFIIWHLLGLKFGPVYETSYDGVVMRDLYRLLIEYFQSHMNVTFYIISMFAMGIHVSHGFWSSFQSIGFYHEKYTPMLRTIAIVFAISVGVGFSILPIYCHLQGAH